MNKIIIALGLSLAASSGALAASTAMDAYEAPAAKGAIAAPVVASSNDLVSYDRAGNDGSPVFLAPQGGIDYTATASIGEASSDQIIYDRAGNDGSPRFH